MNKTAIFLLCLVASASLAHGQFAATGTTTLAVTVGSESGIQVNTTNTALASGSVFGAYSGTTSLTYKIRTSASTGTGSITLQVTSDFSGTGGPSVASPPTVGDTLAYTCTVSSPATGCSGTVTSSTAAATSVATFGADAHSSTVGTSGSVAWTLTNDPAYKAGSYSSTVTFTISAS